ncbi:19268_t:CDS:1, partial [Cetraspora pellucida]
MSSNNGKKKFLIDLSSFLTLSKMTKVIGNNVLRRASYKSCLDEYDSSIIDVIA